MILGIDVGGSSIKFGVFNQLDLIYKNSILTPKTGWQEVIQEINNIIYNISKKYDIVDVGIGFPSVVSKDYFVHIAPNINNFKNVDLKSEICNEFPSLIIKIDNDANAAALAELKYGNGVGLNNFIYVTLGSGIGGSIIINKNIFYGDTHGAGEIGYSNFKYDELENKVSNRTGIFEEYLGRVQFTKYFNNKYDYKIDSPKDIFLMAENNNQDALSAFEHYGKLLGFGLASLMNILDIHNVIIGGGITKAEKYFIESTNNSILNKKLNHIKPNIQIAKFIDETGIYGAMALV